MSFINSTAACDYKLKCLEIAARSSLAPEAQLTYAKDMFALVVVGHLKAEITQGPLVVPLPTTPYPTNGVMTSATEASSVEQQLATEAAIGRLRNTLKKAYS